MAVTSSSSKETCTAFQNPRSQVSSSASGSLLLTGSVKILSHFASAQPSIFSSIRRKGAPRPSPAPGPSTETRSSENVAIRSLFDSPSAKTYPLSIRPCGSPVPSPRANGYDKCTPTVVARQPRCSSRTPSPRRRVLSTMRQSLSAHRYRGREGNRGSQDVPCW